MKDLLNVQDYLFAVQDVGDWEGEWESDTGTIHLADSDSSDDEDE